MDARCTICADRTATAPPCACGHVACRSCERRCVLEHVHAAACVSCGREWDVEEAVKRLGKVFWATGYRRMRRKELRRREESRLPDARHEAERRREERRLRARVREVQTRVVEEQRMELLPELRRRQHLLYVFLHGDAQGAPAPSAWTPRCAHADCEAPLPDGGGGGVVACTRCERRTCVACGESVDGAHTCDAAVLATRAAIRRDCKPCARCRAPSYKAEGCDVMWCAHCHTFWNWTTERVVETRGAYAPHNPDHRDHVARTRTQALRELDDLPCGGLPDGILVHSAFMRDASAYAHLAVLAPIVIEALEALHHAQRVLRARFPRAWTEDELFRTARVAHLMGDTSEDAYATTLERLERGADFKRSVGHALELFVMAGADVFQRLCGGADDAVTACYALVQLREVVDGRLATLAVAHQRKAPRLSERWVWVV